MVDKIYRCIFYIPSTVIDEYKMNLLAEWGFLVFLDSQEMELGNSFPSTIMNAIYSASVHIAIFSKRLRFGNSFPSTILKVIYSASVHIAIFSKRLRIGNSFPSIIVIVICPVSVHIAKVLKYLCQFNLLSSPSQKS